MTGWTITLLIVALIAATLGFGGFPGFAASVARGFCWLAFAAAAVTGLTAILQSRR